MESFESKSDEAKSLELIYNSMLPSQEAKLISLQLYFDKKKKEQKEANDVLSQQSYNDRVETALINSKASITDEIKQKREIITTEEEGLSEIRKELRSKISARSEQILSLYKAYVSPELNETEQQEIWNQIEALQKEQAEESATNDLLFQNIMEGWDKKKALAEQLLQVHSVSVNDAKQSDEPKSAEMKKDDEDEDEEFKKALEASKYDQRPVSPSSHVEELQLELVTIRIQRETLKEVAPLDRFIDGGSSMNQTDQETYNLLVEEEARIEHELIEARRALVDKSSQTMSGNETQ
jgi:hypothetical protein